MGKTTKYWKGLEELDQTPEFVQESQKEFSQPIPVDEFLQDESLTKATTGRRDFLKFLGFSVSAATLAACETPVIKSIPYVQKPEEITPGVAIWYASTYYDGNDYGSILVKTREGRPIFIKGNKEFGTSNGVVNARINSSVLSLYDSTRLQNPLQENQNASWEAVDAAIKKELDAANASGKEVVILSNTIISPTTKKAIGEFSGKFSAKHISYDPISYNGIRKANENSFGKSVIPTYDFSKAKTIVSIVADFMGNWLMHNDYIQGYVQTRKPDTGSMSRHFQFESVLSLSGANADVREQIKPSQEGLVAASIYKQLSKISGLGQSLSVTVPSEIDEMTTQAAKELWKNKGKALVVAGSNDVATQMVVNSINEMLGSYSSTIDLDNPYKTFQGNDQAMENLVKDMNAGKVGALIVYGVNPVYSYYNGAAFKSGLEKVKTSISFSSHNDETATLCGYVCPDHHYLESWNDLNPKKGHYALVQPTISPLFDTRQAQESFLMWAGNNTSYHDYLKEHWSGEMSTEEWYTALHNGGAEINMGGSEGTSSDAATEDTENTPASMGAAASAINKMAKMHTGGYEAVFYQKAGMGTGSHANNPWLQELPDPISRVSWDNYVTMAPADMRKEENDFNIYIGEQSPASLVTVKINGKEVQLPAYASPGQTPGTIGIALGYGRGANSENIGNAAFQTEDNGDFVEEDGNRVPVGKNAYPFVSSMNGTFCYKGFNAAIENTGNTYALASVQTQNTVMSRTSVFRETNLDTYKNGSKKDYNPAHTLSVHEDGKTVKKPIKEIDLWDAHPVEGVGHRWGMSIDLTDCIGCGACVTSCHIENNVPVVGKDEVRRTRNMHWLRIDRYYSSVEDKNRKANKKDGQTDFSYSELRKPEDDPQTAFMPMLCQHCNHAPCETVCPVAATTHSNEGLNQMTYNRCIGTRYCANNCPYKVRRFNWFNYPTYKKFKYPNFVQNDIGRMVLNPDVTVRARGVMEKCSMCVQRIQAGKLQAKKEQHPVKDGQIQTACQAACPTGAITFGDLNDNKSKVAENASHNRAYSALEEVGTQPNIYYLTKVRNTENA